MALADVVESLTEFSLQDGVVILPRSAVVRELKAHEDELSIDHETVRAAFNGAGWTYSRHLYFHPDELADRARVIADSLRTNRLLVSESEFVGRVAEPTPVGSETGWQKSAAIETIREQAGTAGWQVRRATKPVSDATASQVLYFRPLRAVIEAEHPQGRRAFTTNDLLAWYLAQSVQHELESQ